MARVGSVGRRQVRLVHEVLNTGEAFNPAIVYFGSTEECRPGMSDKWRDGSNGKVLGDCPWVGFRRSVERSTDDGDGSSGSASRI